MEAGQINEGNKFPTGKIFLGSLGFLLLVILGNRLLGSGDQQQNSLNSLQNNAVIQQTSADALIPAAADAQQATTQTPELTPTPDSSAAQTLIPATAITPTPV